MYEDVALDSLRPEAVGRYLLYDRIASGGMAAVHLGRLVGPLGFSRTVAVKRMLSHAMGDPEMIRMFVDEARLAARIQHPNVVLVIDVVVVNAELFIVMEHVHGASLSGLVLAQKAQKTLVPPQLAAGVMVGVLEGLHAAHEATNEHGAPLDMVHRDVSPQNILVGLDGVPRVADFGIAKAIGRLQTTTRDGQLKGKAGYLSPEQVLGGKVDRRTDVYGAAVVLWEVLAGRRLFKSDTAVNTVQLVVERKIEPPSRFAPRVSTNLDEIVMRGLSRDPNDRFATASEMAVALERAVPPATTRELGRWVALLAEGSLVRRAKRIADIERDSATRAPLLPPTRARVDSSIPTETSHTPVDTPGSVSPATIGSSDRLGARAARYRAAIFISGAALLVMSALFVVTQRRTTATHTLAATSASSTAPLEAPPSSPIASSGSADSTPPAESADVAALGNPTPTPSQRRGTGLGKSRTAIPRSAASSLSSDCANPFTWTQDGVKIPKAECFR